MTIATTIAALQVVHLTITGVSSAPTSMPSNLDQVKKPTVLVIPSAATWNPATAGLSGLRRQSREYEVRCYVQPVAQGITGIDAGYDACVTLLDAFGNKYLADISLGNTVDNIRAISDSGVRGGQGGPQWAQVDWWGFIYRVTVSEKSA